MESSRVSLSICECVRGGLRAESVALAGPAGKGCLQVDLQGFGGLQGVNPRHRTGGIYIFIPSIHQLDGTEMTKQGEVRGNSI